MNKKEKTNIAMLWIAILVLGISAVIDSHHDYKLHLQLCLRQKENQEVLLELLEETEYLLHLENQYLKQILNIVKAQ